MEASASSGNRWREHWACTDALASGPHRWEVLGPSWEVGGTGPSLTMPAAPCPVTLALGWPVPWSGSPSRLLSGGTCSRGDLELG